MYTNTLQLAAPLPYTRKSNLWQVDDDTTTIGHLSGLDEATFACQNYDCNTLNTNPYNTSKLMQLFTLKAILCLLSCLFYTLVYLSLNYVALVELFMIDH